MIDKKRDEFYIFCSKEKKKMALKPLTTEHSNSLIDKIKNGKFYKNEIFDDLKYTMKVTINKD